MTHGPLETGGADAEPGYDDLTPTLSLPSLEAIDRLPVEALPALLLGLAAVQTRAAARLRLHSRNPTPARTPDRLLRAQEAADRLSVTPQWLRRRATLPFVVRLSDGVVRYSERGLERFIRVHMGMR